MQVVVTGSIFIRVVAIALLLVSAMNFVAFDLQARTLVPSSQSEDDCGDTGGGHDCFACCGHLVPAIPANLFIQFEQVSIVEEAEPPAPSSKTFEFFRPPKL